MEKTLGVTFKKHANLEFLVALQTPDNRRLV